MQRPLSDQRYTRIQHDEVLSEMRSNMHIERKLIEQSRVRIVRSRQLLVRTEGMVEARGSLGRRK